MKNKKGFTLIELIVVIAILGILALFLVPSFMGYARDAKVQVMKANIKTGQNALLTAYASYDVSDSKYTGKENAPTYIGDVKTKVCENMGNVKCILDVENSKEYPYIKFIVGDAKTDKTEPDIIYYYTDASTFCSYVFPDSSKNWPERWSCMVNGVKVE